MTFADVQDALNHIMAWEIKGNRADHERICKEILRELSPGGKQDLSWLEKDRIGKVVRPKHG